jgi:predicted nucleic acid-binding protein
MSYRDTSALVKLYVQDSDSKIFEGHLLSAASPPATSRVTLYEARATFRRKEAEGMILPGTAQKLYDRLPRDIGARGIRLVELSAEIEAECGLVLDSCHQGAPPIAIRTLDALHLASAKAALESEIVTTDKRRRDAAKLLRLGIFPV